jgi:hypothetical protein
MKRTEKNQASKKKTINSIKTGVKAGDLGSLGL